jgi:uncharacterized membrane protein YeaQ/YmgE (transglycosylase-associated protein family)
VIDPARFAHRRDPSTTIRARLAHRHDDRSHLIAAHRFPVVLHQTCEREAFMALIWFALTGLVAGWLAGLVMKGGGYGIVGDLVVGVLGAVLGGFLFGALGISAGGFAGSIVVATVGAVVLIFLLRLIKRA